MFLLKFQGQPTLKENLVSDTEIVYVQMESLSEFDVMARIGWSKLSLDMRPYDDLKGNFQSSNDLPSCRTYEQSVEQTGLNLN